MTWPAPQDYNEAVQTPSLSLADPEMMEGEPELNPLGLPRAVTGAFASVYKLLCPSGPVAIRCFLHNIPDQRERYKELSRFLVATPLDYMAKFEYLDQGIRIQDDWFPALKMEWIDGEPLEQFLSSRVNQKWALETVLQDFVRIYTDLLGHGIAHGDLQHGNILVVKDEQQGVKLKLVDYDGMFLPSLAGYPSNELGHPNYQHPRRRGTHFGNFLDNFSAWVIYASLKCLLVDSSLWSKLSGGDDCLLFRRSDFRSPSTSHVFNLLQRHASDAVKGLGEILMRLSRAPLEKIPLLNTECTSVHELGLPDELLEETERDDEGTIRLSSAGLPEWTKGSRESESVRQSRSGPWPGIKHYADAVADTKTNFNDPELANGIPSVFDAAVGPSGVVFYMRCLTRHLAVKCFFKHVPDRHERFEAIAKALTGPLKKYFVEFEYQPEGIKVGNYWYPVLKMEWAYGLSLIEASNYYKQDRDFLCSLALNFRTMMETLQQAGIAHGDLQPDNILLVGDHFKLFDYDGMFVPELAGRKSLEQGHLHYRHPDRTLDHFDASIDNYSAWVLDTSLMVLLADYNLWSIINQRLNYCEEDAEWAFRILHGHLNKDMRRRAKVMSSLANGPIGEIPPLDSSFEEQFADSEGVLSQIKKMFQRRK